MASLLSRRAGRNKALFLIAMVVIMFLCSSLINLSAYSRMYATSSTSTSTDATTATIATMDHQSNDTTKFGKDGDNGSNNNGNAKSDDGNRNNNNNDNGGGNKDDVLTMNKMIEDESMSKAKSTTTTTEKIIDSIPSSSLTISNENENQSDETKVVEKDADEKEADEIEIEEKAEDKNDLINNSTENTNTTSTITTNNKPKKFAFAFLIAGCNPKEPNYRGYLYSVAVAKELFNRFNNTHDVIVQVRMHSKTDATKLPIEEEQILTKSGMIVKYLPKVPIDNFHTAMMDKFRVLELTEYERIVYLDADVIPLNNLDYMFELSTASTNNSTTSSSSPPPLEENVILAYNREPSSGGFFMLSPKEGEYEEITALIQKRNKEGYHFNETIGWGHQMIPPDGWEALDGFHGSKWDFYGSFTVS